MLFDKKALIKTTVMGKMLFKCMLKTQNKIAFWKYFWK